MLPWEFFWILTPQSSLSRVSRFIEGASNAWILEKENRFKHGKFYYYIKDMFITKNLTNFHKTVETGVDPRLYM